MKLRFKAFSHRHVRSDQNRYLELELPSSINKP